ncbi:MAG: hypothetical protein ABSH41_17835 [Syntrophobacteraceae bacterium]|jgi:hypothetical protein
MEIPDDAIESILEQMRQMQIGLRNLRAELGKWRQEPEEPAMPALQEEVEPPTEKQIQFLKGLGVEEIPGSKEEARLLLQELNAKKEAGEYSMPPTAKQLKFLKDLKYRGPIPETKDAAWKLLQKLKKD